MPASARRRIACAWLLCQLMAVVATPPIVWAAGAHAEQVECLCGHGPGAFCPMHRHNAPKPFDCVVRSTAPDLTSTLASLLGPIATPPSSERTVTIRVAAQPSRYDRTTLNRPFVPDLPPPRA